VARDGRPTTEDRVHDGGGGRVCIVVDGGDLESPEFWVGMGWRLAWVLATV